MLFKMRKKAEISKKRIVLPLTSTLMVERDGSRPETSQAAPALREMVSAVDIPSIVWERGTNVTSFKKFLCRFGSAVPAVPAVVASLACVQHSRGCKHKYARDVVLITRGLGVRMQRLELERKGKRGNILRSGAGYYFWLSFSRVHWRKVEQNRAHIGDPLLTVTSGRKTRKFIVARCTP